MIKISSIFLAGALAVSVLGCSERISEEEAIQAAGIFLEQNGYPKANELNFAMRWEAGAWQGKVEPKNDLLDTEEKISWPIFIEISRHGAVTGFMGFLEGKPEP